MTKDDRQPLVAVVTPVYNGAPYLEKTLACVQAQAYPNLVHIVLDNASTDRTPQLIEAAKGGRVPIVTKRNASTLPQTENWNEAISMVPRNARYLKLLPADDLMRADCIDKMVTLAESDPEIDFVHAIDVVGEVAKPHGMDDTRSIYTGAEYGRLFLTDRIWLGAAHLFFRVTPDRLDHPFRPETHPRIDRDFIFRKLLDRKVGFVHEPILFTRYHEQTETHKQGGTRLFIAPNLQMLYRFGPKFLEPAELEKQKKRDLLKLLRHVIQWQMTGNPGNAGKALQAIADLDIRPNAIDYIESVLVWPAYKIANWLNPRRGPTFKNEVEEFHDGIADRA
jgi:glycosyltransferase involved in cell wall biosynthesis